MIDAKLIDQWYDAARDEFVAIMAAYRKDACKIERVEHVVLNTTVAINEDSGLVIQYRQGPSSRFSAYVGSAVFPVTVFLDVVTLVNGEIEKRWKFLEDYRAQQEKAREEMDGILRKQISSWRLLGKDVKPP